MTIDEVMEHLKASNSDHVRCVLETDENMVLLDYIETQGRYVSAEDRARNEADAAKQAELEAKDAPVFVEYEESTPKKGKGSK